MKKTLIWFNLQTDRTGNGLSNIKDTFAESSAPKYEHLLVPAFMAGISSSYNGWGKCKEKVPDVSNPNQNVETPCNPKLKFT